eukprot:799589-Pleurochrysis_carterae.AAC.1
MKAGREGRKDTRDSQANERDLAGVVQNGVGADGRAHARTVVTGADVGVTPRDLPMKAEREEGKRTCDLQVNERDVACAVQHGVGADGRAHACTAVTPARGGKGEKGEGEHSHARILCMR